MSTFQIDFGNEQSRIVGIDLGTTNSLIAVMEPTGPRILSGIVPSVVSVTPDGDVIVGAEAREMLITHSGRSVYSVKRLMGRGAEDIQEELKSSSFHLADAGGSVLKPSVGREGGDPAGSIGSHLAQAQDGCGDGARHANHASCHHGAGVFQRRAAAGDQRRGPDRGIECAAAGE